MGRIYFLRSLSWALLGLTFALQWTSSLQQGDCNFDTTLCGYQQDNTDDFDWTRNLGTTSTTNTGPSSDHTTGSGYYMYIETSSQATGDVARLISPSLSNSIRCLEFWYHMYGDTAERLSVYMRPTGNSQPDVLIWSKTGDKGDVWKLARVHLEEDSDFKVVFEGVRGTSYRGDIAIDDVSFRSTPCGNCDFDTTLCGYQQDNTDDFDWTRQQGTTATANTGPLSDHTTGSDSYMYIETSSPQQPGDIARLMSPVLSGDSRCLEFWYHMYGSDAEELRVYLSSTGSYQLGTLIWSLMGDQGDVWHNATVNLVAGSNFYIVFEGVRGSGFNGDIAIDDVSIKTTLCDGTIIVDATTTAGSTVTPTTTTANMASYAVSTAAGTTTLLASTPAQETPSQVDCNFDTDMCGYQQSRADVFDWTRKYGSTATPDTGPSSDHSGNGYYMYIEASPPRIPGDFALLISPSLPNGTRCLEFWYHMYGSDTRELSVYLKPVDSTQLGTPIWSLVGDQGNAWDQARLDLVTASAFNIVFEGIRGSGIYGDIAIDDVSFKSTPCGNGGCGFESNLCGYQQDNTDDFDWTRQQGNTLTDNTGPSSDHTSGFGYYMYIETSSPQQPGDVARLISPSLSNGIKCLQFWYHMYGDSTEELRVYQRFIGSADLGTPIWSQTGDQGDVWLQATVDLVAARNFYVVFEGVRGASYHGDIAIDDVSFKTKPCGGGASTSEATTNPAPTTPEPTTQDSTTDVITTFEATTNSVPTTPEPTTQDSTTDVITTPEATTDSAPTTLEPTTQDSTTDVITTPEATTDSTPTTPEPTTQDSTTEVATTSEATTKPLPSTPEPTTQDSTTEVASTSEALTTTSVFAVTTVATNTQSVAPTAAQVATKGKYPLDECLIE